MHAQALPDAVAEHEPRIEHGDGRFGAALQHAVDRDEHVRVARIVDVVVRAVLRHRDLPSDFGLGVAFAARFFAAGLRRAAASARRAHGSIAPGSSSASSGAVQ